MPAKVMTRAKLDAELRALQLEYRKVQDEPLPREASQAQRRARALGLLALPDKLAQLRRAASAPEGCPAALFEGLSRNVRGLLSQARGVCGDVRECTYTEKEQR